MHSYASQPSRENVPLQLHSFFPLRNTDACFRRIVMALTVCSCLVSTGLKRQPRQPLRAFLATAFRSPSRSNLNKGIFGGRLAPSPFRITGLKQSKKRRPSSGCRQALDDETKWMCEKETNPSAERNKMIISKTITTLLTSGFDAAPPEQRSPAKSLSILEIASGTGQHAEAISSSLLRVLEPLNVSVSWQPSDLNEQRFPSILAWALSSRLSQNGVIRNPIKIDASRTSWEEELLENPEIEKSKRYDVVYCSNCIHIAPWDVARGILRGSGRLLRENGVVIFYGPFAVNGTLSPDSNISFHRYLKTENSDWGIRDIRDVETEARHNGLLLKEMLPMPANNFLVVFQKQGA
mmetsp:Transcript_31227/g.50726  ORF Transcript_31227/g.50726 Transcript_31227/m.50726 type:complete len:351 (+) Transcript_31227:1-1053(+)